MAPARSAAVELPLILLLCIATGARAWGCLTTWVQLQTAVSHTPSPTGVLDIPICNGAVIDFTKSYDPYVGLLIYAGNVSALIHYTPLGFNPTKDAPCVRAQQPPRPSALSSAHSYLGKGVNENTTTINFYCGPCGSPASCSCTFDGGNSSGLVSSAYGDTTIAGLDSPVGRLTTLSFTNITFQNGRLVGGAGAGLYVLSSPARPMSVVTQSCVFRGNFAGQAAAVDVIASVSLSAFDTVFERNSGAGSVLFSGNAVVITGAVATLERCLFKDNTAPGGAGGALYLGPFDNESFSNYIPQAPANVFLPGLATVLNSRFDGNAAANGGSVFVNTRYASSTFVSAGNTWAGGKAKCGSDIFLGRDVVSFNSASPATVVVSAQTNPPCRSLQVFAGVYNQSDYAKTASVCDTANPPFSVNHEAASVYACSAF